MVIQHTTEQLAQLSGTVVGLAHNLTTTAPPSLTLPQGLRLPNLVLPHYTGKENLDRFIEQLETILKSSGVPSKFWVTYLKQQTQKDPRVYDVICAADKENQAILGTDIETCSPSEFQRHYEACINALKAKRGKPRDHQLRELLGTYYTLCQQANDSVADFAHSFRETQHELEKLLPAIHRTPIQIKMEIQKWS